MSRLTDMAGAQLHVCRLWQVPSNGQIVNIGGHPYRVIDVGWALPDADAVDPTVAQFAYVKVQKASDF